MTKGTAGGERAGAAHTEFHLIRAGSWWPAVKIEFLVVSNKGSRHIMLRAPPSNLRKLVIALCSVGLASVPTRALTQFSFNFGTAGTVQSSIANQTCGSGSTGGMMGGGTCDGTAFTQEVTNIGGTNYYHVIIGSKTADFGVEYYIRTVTGSVCWYGCSGARGGTGMGGMGGGGIAPLSASAGSGGLSGNNTDPLASSNSGVGRPDQTAIYQFNKTSQMTQEFLKATESKKPKITQTVNLPDTTINFAIDMSAIAYTTSATAGNLTLAQSVNGGSQMPATQKLPNGTTLPSSSNFDVSSVAATAQVVVTGGRYTYSAGSGDGGSMGTYTYFSDSFNPYNVNWTSFCDPAQNPASSCTNYGGTAGGGMGGGSTSGGATSSTTSSTASGTTTTTAAGGGMGGGM